MPSLSHVNYGKWAEAGVPHKGWYPVGDVEDLGNPELTCEMCERQEVRYVQTMAHGNYPSVLRVGCVCAGKMEEDPAAARTRERLRRSKTQRRERWTESGWKHSRRGNQFKSTSDGFHVVVKVNDDGTWGGVISDSVTSKKHWSKKKHKDAIEAKLAAFDAIPLLKKKWRLS